MRLRSWGYEGLFDQMPYTVILDVIASYGFDWVSGRVPDVFSPEFEAHTERVAAARLATSRTCTAPRVRERGC